MRCPRALAAAAYGLLLLSTAADAATLVGVARIPADAVDSLGETLGGVGSGMALVPGSWRRTAKGYKGKLLLLPDRGWNTAGTVDYRARVQKFDVSLIPDDGAPGHEGQLTLTFRRSLLLIDGEGAPTTGLDPVAVRSATAGLPDLPVAANGHVSLDDEAVAADRKGGFWIGDEYGPYVYHYDAQGRMKAVLRPPEAFIPRRNGAQDFSANSPARGTTYDKGDPDSGRQNNQGFEGLSLSPDGHTLFVANQSALRRDLDPAQVKATRRTIRLLTYDLADKTPRLTHEYAIQLPTYRDGSQTGVAAQSELLALDDHRFLLLCRDSGGGFTAKRAQSLYRRIELVDVREATDIMGRYDGAGDSIAPNGALRPDIKPAAMTDLIDLNDNSQLGRFDLHNGMPNDTHDLYEKWESLALAPSGRPGEYILLVGSDNDFITQHGHMAGETYADSIGADVDTLVMAWRVTLP